MGREKSNPYESPRCQGNSSSDGQANSLIRGLGFAVPLGVLGFVIPLAIGLVIQLIQQMNSPYAEPPAIDFNSIFDEFFSASIGCAILFTLSAILNYSPAIRLGLVRSLLFVGLSAFAGMFFSAFITLAFGLEQRTYTSDPWRWVRVFLAASIPVGYTFYHTQTRFSQKPADSGAPAQIDG